MSGEQADSRPGKVAEHSGSARLLEWLDALAKLVGAFAIVAVALVANSLQSRITGVSIQSQREQAESQLRANMFTNLITPIVGSQKEGSPISPDRERLLVELLALNFHENIELKPLMEDVCQRLTPKTSSRRNNLQQEPDPREPLWSIARRIAERQKASIALEWVAYRSSLQERSSWPACLVSWWGTADQSRIHGCEVYLLTLGTGPNQSEAKAECTVSKQFRETIDLKSPDGNYTLRMYVVDPDWNNQTVGVSVTPFLSKLGQPGPTSPAYRFRLTWFDLPFTDNTLLPDGNRFAIYLRLFGPEFQQVIVAVMWFPKGYFTPRERPLNYLAVQSLLGRDTP